VQGDCRLPGLRPPVTVACTLYAHNQIAEHYFQGEPVDNQDQIRLFDGDSLAGYLDSRQRAVGSLVDSITREQFLAASAETLVRQVVDQLAIAPLVLHLDKMQSRQDDTKIRKMVDADDYGMPVRREQTVRAHKLSWIIPFSGEALLWQMNNGPRGEHLGVVDAGQGLLTLTLENTTDVEPSWYQRQMEQTMNEIDRVISDQGNRLAQFRGKLAEAAESALARRRRHVPT